MTTVTRHEKRDEKVIDTAHGKREFGGPIGALLYILFLPAVVIGVNLACTKVFIKPSTNLLVVGVL